MPAGLAEMKRCGRCGEHKPHHQFGKVNGKIRSYCRDCHKSYMRLPDLRTEKRCSKCNTIKPVGEFNKCGKQYQPYCRPCNQEVSRTYKVTYKSSGKHAIYWRGYYEEVKRWARMLIRHGIAREQYETLESNQEGLCAICRKPETEVFRGTVLRLSVDHDHKTGKVRGLLCRACNLAIGKLKEDINLLIAATDYLRSHQEKSE